MTPESPLDRLVDAAEELYRSSWRDRLAHRLATAALRLATPWYRAMIKGSIRKGLQAAAVEAADDHGTTPAPAEESHE